MTVATSPGTYIALSSVIVTDDIVAEPARTETAADVYVAVEPAATLENVNSEVPAVRAVKSNDAIPVEAVTAVPLANTVVVPDRAKTVAEGTTFPLASLTRTVIAPVEAVEPTAITGLTLTAQQLLL